MIYFGLYEESKLRLGAALNLNPDNTAVEATAGAFAAVVGAVATQVLPLTAAAAAAAHPCLRLAARHRRFTALP